MSFEKLRIWPFLMMKCPYISFELRDIEVASGVGEWRPEVGGLQGCCRPANWELGKSQRGLPVNRPTGGGWVLVNGTIRVTSQHPSY